MKPCDCKSKEETLLLNEQGICFNEYSLTVVPNSVIISNRTVSWRVPMHRFKQWAEWYLTDQQEGE